jgi:uncharacterized protein (DUF885 family)
MAQTPTRQLAARLSDRLLAANPFGATALGLREYDALVPDASAAAEDQLIDDLRAIGQEAAWLEPGTPEDVVTHAVVRWTCDLTVRTIANRPAEHTTVPAPTPGSGTPTLVATLARTALADVPAAEDFLQRVSRSSAYVEQTTQRLREGAARGRFPVASLLARTIEWADRLLVEPVPAALVTPSPPDGWDGAAAWRAALERTVRDELVPAIARWRDQLRALRDGARPDEEAGISALPDGDQDYDAAVNYHTTLPFTGRELHAIGLEAVEQLEERALKLASSIGLNSLDDVRAAMRASAAAMRAEDALLQAQEAVRRAEARAAEMMPQPLPAPCVVTPMPPPVAEAGMAPHYTAPRLDGSRPGTFWFNTMRATVGTGWDLEAVAFHETVPGHHSQLARLQQLPDLPFLQQLGSTAHAEGWGLYAERLAGETGLYSGVEAEIGSVYVELFRAARLVVDTGLHALGWSRQRAREYFVEHVALPEGFLFDEIDRYIAWPGQALAYLVGQRELLRLRDMARGALGADFDLPRFHAVVLDSGRLPMTVLADVVRRWAGLPT